MSRQRRPKWPWPRPLGNALSIPVHLLLVVVVVVLVLLGHATTGLAGGIGAGAADDGLAAGTTGLATTDDAVAVDAAEDVNAGDATDLAAATTTAFDAADLAMATTGHAASAATGSVATGLAAADGADLITAAAVDLTGVTAAADDVGLAAADDLAAAAGDAFATTAYDLPAGVATANEYDAAADMTAAAELTAAAVAAAASNAAAATDAGGGGGAFAVVVDADGTVSIASAPIPVVPASPPSQPPTPDSAAADPVLATALPSFFALHACTMAVMMRVAASNNHNACDTARRLVADLGVVAAHAAAVWELVAAAPDTREPAAGAWLPREVGLEILPSLALLHETEIGADGSPLPPTLLATPRLNLACRLAHCSDAQAAALLAVFASERGAEACLAQEPAAVPCAEMPAYVGAASDDDAHATHTPVAEDDPAVNQPPPPPPQYHHQQQPAGEYADVAVWLARHLPAMRTAAIECGVPPPAGTAALHLIDAYTYATNGLARYLPPVAVLDDEDGSVVLPAAVAVDANNGDFACDDLDLNPGGLPFYVNASAVARATARVDAVTRQLVDDGTRDISTRRWPHISPQTVLAALPRGKPADATTAARGEAVRRGFLHAWRAYEEYAHGADVLLPHSRRGEGELCKMALTLVDSLDTLLVARAWPAYERARAWMERHFTIGGQADINLFETTIRVVGGLAAAGAVAGDEGATAAAAAVMDAMLATGAYDVPHGVPYGTLTLAAPEAAAAAAATTPLRGVGAELEGAEGLPGPGVRGRAGHAYNPNWIGGSSTTSEVATLQVELLHLAAATRNASYATYAHATMRNLARVAPRDGLFPIYMDPATGGFKNAVVTLGARGDSAYEYLLKSWVLMGGWEAEARLAKVLAAAGLRVTMHRLALAGGCAPAGPRSNPAAAAACEMWSDYAAAWRHGGVADDLAAAATDAPLDASRHLLELYNRAVGGIVDRLLGVSSPGSRWFIHEQSASTAAEASPSLIPKMDHLVCFLPGVLAVGLLHDAGHEVLARQRDTAYLIDAAADAVLALTREERDAVRPLAATYNDAEWISILVANAAAAAVAVRAAPAEILAGRFDRLPPVVSSSYDAAADLTSAVFTPATPDTPCACSPATVQALGRCFCALESPDAVRAALRQLAEQLTATCVAMYDTTATGLAPEIVTFTPGADFAPNHDAAHSLLRPETAESLFLLYRLTGNATYRDAGWRMFGAMERHARVRTGGYASVRDVRLAEDGGSAGGGVNWGSGSANQMDKMESFALAETFKYLSLLFADGEPSATAAAAAAAAADTIVPDKATQLGGGSDGSMLDLHSWVYNTEAHPVRVLPAPLSTLVRSVD